MLQTEKNHYDVIVIGGGATGAGTARDCAMRGLKTLLVERKDFTEITAFCIVARVMPSPTRSRLRSVSARI